jgi:uncharacterized membrane protein YgcG
VRSADVFGFGIGLLALMLVFGLFALWAGVAKQVNADQMRHLDRLTPGAQRTVRWQSWALHNLPVPVLAGFVGTYVLAIGTIVLDSSTDGLALWIYFTPSRLVAQVFDVHVPGAALYFWAIVIASAVLLWRRRKERVRWRWRWVSGSLGRHLRGGAVAPGGFAGGGWCVDALEGPLGSPLD